VSGCASHGQTVRAVRLPIGLPMAAARVERRGVRSIGHGLASARVRLEAAVGRTEARLDAVRWPAKNRRDAPSC
jgi:hypothetical protein